MKYDDALILAKELVEALSPACRRIEIAGSVRRQKPECHDLEIVAIPSWEVQQRLNLFGEVGEIIQVNRLDQRLAELFDAGEWVLDEKLPRNGPKYKRLAHLATGLCCDLFLITRQGVARWSSGLGQPISAERLLQSRFDKASTSRMVIFFMGIRKKRDVPMARNARGSFRRLRKKIS